MHAEKDEKRSLTAEENARFEQVKMLVKDVDLTTPEGADYADQLLLEYNLPHYLVFALKYTPTSEAGMRWAAKRLQEMRDSGELR